jgi:hypothetical protein
MATVYSESFEDTPVRQATALAVPRRRRLPWLLAIGLAIALAAPTVIGYTPLRGWALGFASAKLNGSLECESLSLGWFTSLQASGVALRDAKGQVIVEASRVALPKSILGLLFSPSELGTIRVDNPRLHVVFTATGSNVEDVIAPLLAPDATDRKRLAAIVEIAGGAGTIEDQARRRQWELTSLDGTINLLGEGDVAASGKVAAQLRADPDTPHATCEFEIPNAAADAKAARINLAITCDRFPLEVCEPLVRRFDAATELSGRLTGDAKIGWATGDARGFAVQGRIAANGVVWGGSSVGKDRLRLRHVEGPIDIAWDGKQLEVQGTSVTCDVGTMSVQGSAAVSQLNVAQLGAALAAASLELTADVDIAPVAAMFPDTLRVRPGTRIIGGKLQASFGRRLDAGGQTSAGQIEVSRLVAEEQGQPITWDKPLRVSFNVSETKQGLVVRELVAAADFLEVQGSGSLDRFSATTRFDLDRLVHELGRFVDLRGVQLSGSGNGKLEASRAEDGIMSGHGEFDVRGFRFAMPGDRLWQEDNLSVRLSATGEVHADRGATSADGRAASSALHTAVVSFSSAGEEVRIQLAKPIFRFTSNSDWPIAVRILDGNLANWSARLRPWIALGAWQASGNCNATATLTWSTAGLELTQCDATLDDLVVANGASNVFTDRNLVLGASGRWDRQGGPLLVYRATARGTSAAVDATDCRFGAAETSGQASFQVDLARASNWLTPLLGASGAQLVGQASGSVQLESKGGLVHAVGKLNGDNLAVAAGANSNHLVDRRLQAAVDATYDRAADVLRVDTCEINGEAVRLAARGSLAGWSTSPAIDVAGQVDYDLERLMPLLRWYAGDGLKATGRGPQNFVIRGPLDSALVTVPPVSAGARETQAPHWRAALNAEAGIGWTSLGWQGFNLGPGKLHGRMAEGRLVVDPFDVPIDDGRLTLAPQVYLATDPIAFALPKGPVLKQVRITPELCAAGLKYINPFLAGVTSVNGNVSMDLDGAWVPLGNAQQASAAGKLKIERVEVSGGPLLGDVLPAILLMKPARVPLLPDVQFWVQNGRVYHKGVGIELQGTTVTTSGSVGFDESLDIVAEMTVPEKWLGGNVLGKALKNQKIKIPIRGTLHSPQVDAKELARLRSEFVGEAAGNVIRDELLDRLLKPRQ